MSTTKAPFARPEYGYRPRNHAIVFHASLAFLVAIQSGCTSVQLRKSTIRHSMTLSDIYTQQVLNNVAMFVQNPAALPFFAFPNQGTTSVQDTGTVGNPGYKSGNFTSSDFVLNGSRQQTENWVLVPVSDPGKLSLMRCAYRQAISGCFGVDFIGYADCPDCRKLRKDFYGPVDPEKKNPHYNEEQPCLNSDCWFRCTCKRHVAKNCRPPYVGSYDGMYVWVPPQGREMLTRLTLAILDYAVNDAQQFDKRTKEVVLNLDADGMPVANKDESETDQSKPSQSKPVARRVTAVIPIDQPSSVVLALDRAQDYAEFLKLFGRDAATLLYQFGEARRRMGDHIRDHDRFWAEFWQEKTEFDIKKMVEKYSSTPPFAEDNMDFVNAVNSLSEREVENIKKAAKYVIDKKIYPRDVPSEELLRGPAVYGKKLQASSGLQSLQQRLEAASPR